MKLMKEIGLPRCAAIEATTTFAQGERPPYGFEVRHAHLPHVLNQRDERRDERDIVDERRSISAHPKNEHRGRREIAVRDLDRLFCKHLDDARFDERADEDEETCEEEDGEPFDLRQDLRDHRFLLRVADEEQKTCARHGGGRRIKVELTV